MNIKCPKCGREHSLPDNSSDNKRIYFFCTQCRHKIVIDGRKNFIAGTTGTLTFKEEAPLPTVTDILDILPRFFKPSSFIMSLVFAVSSIIIVLLTCLLLFKNIDFFTQHTVALILAAGCSLSVILFSYTLLLYFISKIQFYTIDHPFDETLDWKFILFDFSEDAAVLFIISVGILISASAIMVPAILLESWGLLYAGILFPVIFAAFLFLITAAILHRFIPAVVASRSLYPNQTIFQMVRFFIREIINIPFYLIIVDLVSCFIFLILGSLFFGALALTSAGIAAAAGSSSLEQIKTIVLSLPVLFTSGSASFMDAVPGQITAGIFTILFFFFIFALCFWGLMLNIKQSLITQACWIMQNNPAHSIPKYAIILALCAVFVLFIISSSGAFSAVSGLIK